VQEVVHCEIHHTVPLLQIKLCYLSIIYGNGDGNGDSCMRGWMGTGTILTLVAGIEGENGEFWGQSAMGINISPHAAL